MLVTDPQTSGGLLVSCSAAAEDAVLAQFRAAGFADAAHIGTMLSPAAAGGAGIRFTV